MGIFGKLFSSGSESEEEIDNSERVIERLKRHRGQDTGKWLNLMRDPAAAIQVGPPPTVEDVDQRTELNEKPYSPPFQAQYTTLMPNAAPPVPVAIPKTAAPTDSAILRWVNGLFSEFAFQAAQFNSSATGTKFAVTVRNPAVTYEAPKFGEYTDVKKLDVVKGHIGTQNWAMWVQAYETNIDIYVIPAEMLLKFTLDDIRKSSFEPFMTIDVTPKEGGDIDLTIAGSPVPPNSVQLMARELIADLIRIASGQMVEEELFAEISEELKLGQNVAKGVAMPTPTSTPSPTPTNDAPQPSLEVSEPASFERLASWKAGEQMIKAIEKDILYLNEQEGAIGQDAAIVEKARAISSKLRTIAGEWSGLTAEYHPRAGSKYNAS